MVQIWVFDTSEVRAASKAIRNQLANELGFEPTSSQIVAYAVNKLDTCLSSADLSEGYNLYTQYLVGNPEETRLILDEVTMARIQAIGKKLEPTQPPVSIKSPKGYNRKLIILLALIAAGQGD